MLFSLFNSPRISYNLCKDFMKFNNNKLSRNKRVDLELIYHRSNP